ncbi:MAG TPA: DUF4142 domain-containing protein [Thermoanaerobaculia bacterium]|jgi:putative membrane protein|nr:DUF4142 domain-containing protein [Thermoanaerobaculia bacterium]
MNTHRISIAAGVLVFALVACTKNEEAVTETTATTVTSPAGEASPPPPANLTPGDREFAEKAARMGMAEVQLATNVSNRAASPDVRAFAQKMLEDHNRSNQELTALASQKGIDPPADLDPEHKALDEELAKLTGAALDKRYMEAMVKDHATASQEFEAASQQLADADLKAWAAKTVPVLHQHHQMADDIMKKLQ